MTVKLTKLLSAISRKLKAGHGLLYGARSTQSVFLPPVRRTRPRDGYLSISAIAKNEGSYLVEWLEFHFLVGVEHVYIYDHDSDDDTFEVLQPYVEAGKLTLIPWASFDRSGVPQYQAYAHALCNFGPYWRWMAFIDLDEFLFPLDDESLPAALTAYEDLPALAVHWHMFGFSGNKRRPAGLVIENYTRRAPIPALVEGGISLSKWKSIVNPARVKSVSNPHLFVLEDGREGAYDENRRWIIRRDRAKAASSILRLNHYFTKSEEEFAAKIARGDAGHAPSRGERPKMFATKRAQSIEAQTVEDNAILHFADLLREQVARTAR